MPTLNWIREGAVDSFYDYLMGLPCPEVRLKCPECRETFSSAEALHSHIRQVHPLRSPRLMVCGKIIRDRWVVRTRPAAADVDLSSTHRAFLEVDGVRREVDAEELIEVLIREEPRFAELLLINVQPATGAEVHERVEIEFKVASAADLGKCDRAFAETSGRAVLALADAVAVRDAIPQSSSAFDYAGALADYLVAVMQKEQLPQSGVLGDLAEYRPKLLGARAVLSEFNTTISRGVRDVIAFNLNLWADFHPVPSFPALCDAERFIASREGYLGTRSKKWAASRKAPQAACYIDRRTSELLSAIEGIAAEAEANRMPPAVELVLDWQANAPITEADQLKRQLLVTVIALHNEQDQIAKHGLHELAKDAFFHEWAVAHLKRLGQ